MASPGAIKAGEAYVELNADDRKFTSKFNRAPGTLKKFQQSIGQINSGVQQIASTAVVTGVALAPIVTQFVAFDDAALAMKAATQTTGDEYDRLRQHALELGRTTSYTATEVATLMTELGRAGFNPREITAMTAAVLDLARATGTDATTATKIMSATIRQFGLDAGQATRVADLLTATANKSFTNVMDLGEALKYSATSAADLGLSLEDTLALLGALGNVGVQGSEAGTALRRINTLAATGNKDLQRLFGVSGQDAAGNVRPLVDVLDEITQATKDMGTAERASKFNEFFGLLGITAASSLGKTAVSVRQLREEIGKADGLASKTAKEMDSGLGGAWRVMKSAAEGAAIAVGSVLGPALGAVAKIIEIGTGRITKWVEENRELATQIGIAVVGLLAIGAASLALVVVAKLFAVIGAAVSIVTGVFGLLGAVIGALLSPVGLVVAAFALLVSQAGSVEEAVGMVFAAIAVPVGLAVVAVIGLIATLRALWDVAKAVGGVLRTIGKEIMSWLGIEKHFAAGIASIQQRLAGIGASLMATFREVGETFGEMFGGIKAAIMSGDLEAAGKIAMLGFESMLLKTWQFLLDQWHGFTNAIVDYFDNAIMSIRVAFLDLTNWLQGKMIGAYVAVVQPVLEGLAVAGVMKVETVNKITTGMDAARLVMEAEYKQGVQGVAAATLGEREARNKRQNDEVKGLGDRSQGARDAMNALIKTVSIDMKPIMAATEVAMAMMLRNMAADIAPMPHEPRGMPSRAEQVGDAVRGLYQSSDFQGAFGMGRGDGVANQQLKETEKVVNVLIQIRDKIIPGVWG